MENYTKEVWHTVGNTSYTVGACGFSVNENCIPGIELRIANINTGISTYINTDDGTDLLLMISSGTLVKS
jgi:hypothetical protein